jgi:hypothetical protein
MEGKFFGPIYRNKDRISDEGYLTDRLSEEAVAFIDRNKTRPLFLYLAYNAVHAPAEAPQADIVEYRQRFSGISDARVILMAMLKQMADPITGGSKRWKAGAMKEELTERERARRKQRLERRKQRKAKKKATQQKVSLTETIR